jgi:hypothetical protein
MGRQAVGTVLHGTENGTVCWAEQAACGARSWRGTSGRGRLPSWSGEEEAAGLGHVGPPIKSSRTRADHMEERQTGVAEGTLVYAWQGKRTTHELAPGDQIWSFDRESHQWRLTSIRRLAVHTVKADMSHLQVGGTRSHRSGYEHGVGAKKELYVFPIELDRGPGNSGDLRSQLQLRRRKRDTAHRQWTAGCHRRRGGNAFAYWCKPSRLARTDSFRVPTRTPASGNRRPSSAIGVDAPHALTLKQGERPERHKCQIRV